MYTIENISGTKVLFVKNSSNIVNIQILTNIGSSDEEKGQYGVAHFLEHMFFKGTSTRDAKKINHDADMIGAKLNAWTWHDQTNYHLSVMKEKFEEGFELLSDIYLNSTFPEEEMERERTVILSEIRRYEDDSPTYLSDLALDHFCLNGLGHSVTGSIESVGNLSREQLLKFKNSYYGGDNSLVAIVGGIDFEDVRRVIEKYFNNVKSNKPSTLTLSDYNSGDFLLQKPDIQESQYQLYYPAYPFLHEKFIVQSVMSFVLGGNASSLLFERIREELGLCYGIYARVNCFDGFNYLEVSTGCSDKDIDLLHKEVLGIINKIKSEQITENRLEMVKSSMLSSIYMSIESSSGLNTYLALGYIRGERGDFLNRKINEIKLITSNQIRDIASEIFSRNPLKAELRPFKN